MKISFLITFCLVNMQFFGQQIDQAVSTQKILAKSLTTSSTSKPLLTISNDTGKLTSVPSLSSRTVSKIPYAPALVNLDDYEKLIKKLKKHRNKSIVSLDEFNILSKETNTIILDTRSDSMFKLKHIKGAIHLNFSDFTQANLLKLIPNFNTRILIYCNNNIDESALTVVTERAFITKSVVPEVAPNGTLPITLALNIPTYINLFGYGYKNVFELGEFVKVNDPRIVFEGTAVK